MPSNLMSGILSSAGQCPCTTKNLHLSVPRLYCSICTDCMFLVLLNCFCDMQGLCYGFREEDSKDLNCIKLPLLVESLLYVMHALHDSSKYYRFYIVTLKIFNFCQVKASVMLVLFYWLGVIILPDFVDQPLLLGGFWSCSCLCTHLHTTWKWLVLPHLSHVLLWAWHCHW